jgi:hypothetical protein
MAQRTVQPQYARPDGQGLIYIQQQPSQPSGPGCCTRTIQNCAACTQTCVNCLLCIYLCNTMFGRGNNKLGAASMLSSFADDASGEDNVNRQLVPAATGGALDDLPLIACARMARDDPGVEEGDALELISDRV